jgi:hypothetical protein
MTTRSVTANSAQAAVSVVMTTLVKRLPASVVVAARVLILNKSPAPILRPRPPPVPRVTLHTSRRAAPLMRKVTRKRMRQSCTSALRNSSSLASANSLASTEAMV